MEETEPTRLRSGFIFLFWEKNKQKRPTKKSSDEDGAGVRLFRSFVSDILCVRCPRRSLQGRAR